MNPESQISNPAALLRRTLNPQVRVLDAGRGIAEYVASDETIDSYREIIRADGWRFDNFAKNAPFVDSHDYSTIRNQVGKVVDFRVVGRQLIETVQWAKDVAENSLAQLGWKMTEAGFLKAVSVGFWPVRTIYKGDEGWTSQLEDLKLDADSKVRAIYLEQQQVELSTVIIGANPNALARAFKAGAIDDADLNTISAEHVRRESAGAAQDPAAAALAHQRAAESFLQKLEQIIRNL
jgi:hypothetical protein